MAHDGCARMGNEKGARGWGNRGGFGKSTGRRLRAGGPPSKPYIARGTDLQGQRNDSRLSRLVEGAGRRPSRRSESEEGTKAEMNHLGSAGLTARATWAGLRELQ